MENFLARVEKYPTFSYVKRSYRVTCYANMFHVRVRRKEVVEGVVTSFIYAPLFGKIIGNFQYL